MLEVIVSVASMASLSGCLQTDSWTILGAAAGPLVRVAPQGTKPGEKAKTEESDDAAEFVPRRVYRASDMLLHSCTTLDGAGAIVGKGCEGGFVVFGPYASVTGESDIRVRFEIESSEELVVSSDIVSNMGALHHGDMENQTVLPNAKRQLRYRTHLPRGGEAVEARIFVRTEDEAQFKISNLEVAVR